MLYLISSDINETSFHRDFNKSISDNDILDLSGVEKFRSVPHEFEKDLIHKLMKLLRVKVDKDSDQFPYISNIYQNSVFPNVQLVHILSDYCVGHDSISLPYKYILKPPRSFYALAKGESQAAFLCDSYKFYYHTIHRWAANHSFKIKYRNQPRLGIIDNCVNTLLRTFALNIKVFAHLLSYFINTIRFNGLFKRDILSRFSVNRVSRLSSLKIFLVRTKNHRKMFLNNAMLSERRCMYTETSLTDNFKSYDIYSGSDAIFSTGFASLRGILGLLMVQLSLIFRKRYFFKAFSFHHRTLSLSLSSGVALSLEDALFEIQQVHLELRLFKQNLSSFLLFCKKNDLSVSEIVSFEGRSPHSFVISSLSKYFKSLYVQYQSCLFGESSPLSIFPPSDYLFIDKREELSKFRSFFFQQKLPEITHSEASLCGIRYIHSHSASPVVFLHPQYKEVNNMLLSCDINRSAYVKFHPRLKSFLADEHFAIVYSDRTISRDIDLVEISYAITYCSAVIVELIAAGIPFICLEPSFDYTTLPFYSQDYLGFCSSVDDALLVSNRLDILLESFSYCYSFS